MLKRFLIIDNEDNVDYVIKVQSKGKIITYTMYRSKASHWNTEVRGEKILTITDKDDDLSIQFEENDVLTLRYHQLMELYNLIDIVKEVGNEVVDFKLIEIPPE